MTIVRSGAPALRQTPRRSACENRARAHRHPRRAACRSRFRQTPGRQQSDTFDSSRRGHPSSALRTAARPRGRRAAAIRMSSSRRSRARLHVVSTCRCADQCRQERRGRRPHCARPGACRWRGTRACSRAEPEERRRTRHVLRSRSTGSRASCGSDTTVMDPRRIAGPRDRRPCGCDSDIGCIRRLALGDPMRAIRHCRTPSSDGNPSSAANHRRRDNAKTRNTTKNAHPRRRR